MPQARCTTMRIGKRIKSGDFAELEQPLRERLLRAQLELAERDYPVVIVIAGLDGAGKGSHYGRVEIKNNKGEVVATSLAEFWNVDTITLYDGATEIGSAEVDADGNWEITPSTPRDDGEHSPTAQSWQM